MDPKLKEAIQELVKGEIKTALDEFKKSLPAGFSREDAEKLFDEKAKSLPAPLAKEDVEKLIAEKPAKAADLKEDETIKSLIATSEKLTADVKALGERVQDSQHNKGTTDDEGLTGLERTKAAIEKKLKK